MRTHLALLRPLCATAWRTADARAASSGTTLRGCDAPTALTAVLRRWWVSTLVLSPGGRGELSNAPRGVPDAPIRPLPGVPHSRLLTVAPVGRVQLKVDEALKECGGSSSSVCVLRRRDGRPGRCACTLASCLCEAPVWRQKLRRGRFSGPEAGLSPHFEAPLRNLLLRGQVTRDGRGEPAGVADWQCGQRG